MDYSRRAVLAATTGALAASLAGCTEEGSFHASNAVVIHREGDDWYDYPEDVGVRATVENTTPNRQSGVLAVTLRQTDGDGEWTRERTVDIGRGSTTSLNVAFEDVADSPNAEFEASARIVEGDSST